MMKMMKDFQEWRQFKAEQQKSKEIGQRIEAGLNAIFAAYEPQIMEAHDAGQSVDVLNATLEFKASADDTPVWMGRHEQGTWDLLAIRQGSPAHMILMSAQNNYEAMSMIAQIIMDEHGGPLPDENAAAAAIRVLRSFGDGSSKDPEQKEERHDDHR